MKRKVLAYLIKPIFKLNRIQFNLIATFFISLGFIIGLYFTTIKLIIPYIFAADTPWTQTDWSGGIVSGTVSSTVITYGSGTDIDATTTAGQFSLDKISGWYNTSWAYRKKITIDHSKVDADLTNFPVLVNLSTDSDLAADAQDDSDDIVFTDSNNSKLDHEIEKFDGSNGELVAWVRIPSLLGGANTDIYLYYGNGSCGSQENGSAVWSNNYKMVQHLDEESGTRSDSTANSVDSAPNGVSHSANGRINGADSFDGNRDYLLINGTSNLDLQDMTISCWTYASNYDANMFMFEKTRTGSVNQQYSLFFNSAGDHQQIYFRTYGLSPRDLSITDHASGPVDGQWNYIVATYDSSGGMKKIYCNGEEIASRSNVTGTVTTNPNGTSWIGTYGGGVGYPFNGLIDEVRISDTARSLEWISTSYNNQNSPESFYNLASKENIYPSSGTLTSNIFDAGFAADWGALTYGSGGSGTVTVKVRTDESSDMSGATSWGTCTAITSGSDLTSNNCVTDEDKYLQYQVKLQPSGASTPIFQDTSIAFTASDQIPPTTNASSVATTTLMSGSWVSTEPNVTWTAGADNDGGSGVKGYCLYLGTTADTTPETSIGILDSSNSPIAASGGCQFIVSSTSCNFSTQGYLSESLTSGTTYYVNIKVIDNSGNVFAESPASFSFKYDETDPTNVSYISSPQGSFSNVVDMSFSWPTSGSPASQDNDSGLFGWQYQIGSIEGTWQGTTKSDTLDLDYIPATASSYTLIESRDESNIENGSNTIYFRSIDNVGNISSNETIRTCSLSYGGAAPTFLAIDNVTVTPSSSSSNSFALSWPQATASSGQSIAGYYYMINTSPPQTYSTLTSNATTYISNSTETSVEKNALPNVNKGTNTVYVVAYDNADTPNYSPSNYISGTFTLNSTDPDNVGSLVASDSSIKTESQWNVTLSWTEPDYKGAGNLTYLVYRSADGETFSEVGSTTGVSYVDTTPESTKYFYKIYSQDGADALSSGTNAVSITPTGKYTTAPTLDSIPKAASITTKKATITWSTSRTCDSKVQYGSSSGSYYTEEPSNSSQVTAHTINLTNLSPGTTYYYKAKWTDEDGNLGTSEEYSFSTDPAPTVKSPKAIKIGISSVILEYTVKGASKVKIYYGKTTAFGGLKEVSTSTSETTYTTTLDGLDDGTKYYYKINTFDTEDDEL